MNDLGKIFRRGCVNFKWIFFLSSSIWKCEIVQKANPIKVYSPPVED